MKRSILVWTTAEPLQRDSAQAPSRSAAGFWKPSCSCGTRRITQTHPETTRVLTHFLAQEFPGDVFLSLNLARDKAMQPHRDSGNSNFPSLLCNLADGAPGGTWIEDPSGTVPRQCADGKVRDGKIVRGFRYRFSANKLWHAPELDATCRTVLVGWVPAGWFHVPTPDMCVKAPKLTSVPNSRKIICEKAKTSDRDISP